MVDHKSSARLRVEEDTGSFEVRLGFSTLVAYHAERFPILAKTDSIGSIAHVIALADSVTALLHQAGLS